MNCPMISSLLLALTTAAPDPADATRAAVNPADRSETADLAAEVREKGWIVYGARTPHGDWDLYLCRPDGSSVRNITNTPDANEGAPRFRPDGRKLLYRRFDREKKIDHDKWGLQGVPILADPDGKNAVELGKEGDLSWASWSSDGKQLACLTRKGILIVDLATKKVIREIPRKGMYQQLFWSPDGKWFCGVSNHLGESWTVARMNARTGEINAVNSFQNCTPDWFPDSERIIFSHRPANQGTNKDYGWTQLYVADGDGKNLELIFGQDGRHIYGGVLSPDGKYVLFTACEEDGGGSEKDGAPMHVMRMADAPTIKGQSKALRKRYPDANDGTVLNLPAGWEPHWTYAEIGGEK